MAIYSIIMFVTAALFLAIGIAIYRGNTKLIHDYHQGRVKEEQRLQYGKAIAKGLFAICAALALSGVIAAFAQSGSAVAAALIVLFAGLAVSLIILVKVQRKYNGGLF